MKTYTYCDSFAGTCFEKVEIIDRLHDNIQKRETYYPKLFRSKSHIPKMFKQTISLQIF